MRQISSHVNSILTKEQLECDYNELGSLTKIAKKYNISDVAVRARFVKYGICFKSKNQRHVCNHNIFMQESERSFYLAGFLAADGCIRVAKTNKKTKYLNHRIVVCLSKKDEKFLELLRSLFESDGKFNYYTNKLSKYKSNWKDSECVKLSITSKQMFEDLKKFNIGPRKSLTYAFPEWLVHHPMVHHFIRGYIDGDGSFYVNTELSYDRICLSVRGTKEFLLILQQLINDRCKIDSKSKICMGAKVGQLRYKGNDTISKIFDLLYHNATIYLPRKYDIAKLSKEI